MTWEFKQEADWLLKSTDYLFEGIESPPHSRLYGCKGCGQRLPREQHDQHLELHRGQLTVGKRSSNGSGEHRAVGALDGLESHRRPIVERIIEMRLAKTSYPAIAETLNAEGVPPFGGGKGWYPVTVRTLYLRHTEEAAS